MAQPEDKNEQPYLVEGFNQMQVKTSRFVREKSNLALVQNGSYEEIGSIGKRGGFTQRGSALTSTTSTSSSSSTTTSSSTSTTTTSTSTTA